MKRSSAIPPLQAPTAAELLANPVIQAALQQAWVDSLPGDPVQRHEEGGWIFVDTATGQITVSRAPSGQQSTLDLRNPPVIAGCVVVATFHTHPYPSAEGWYVGASGFDEFTANMLGVPCLIRAMMAITRRGRREDEADWRAILVSPREGARKRGRDECGNHCT